MYRPLAWLKRWYCIIRIAIGLGKFQSYTLIRLLDTTDRMVASLAAIELLRRIKEDFRGEQMHVNALMSHLSLLEREEREELFGLIATHCETLGTKEAISTATLLPYCISSREEKEGVDAQAVLLRELMRRFKGARGPEAFLRNELLPVVRAADPSIPERNFFGLLLICCSPIDSHVQSLISDHYPDLKPYLFSLVGRLESKQETEVAQPQS